MCGLTLSFTLRKNIIRPAARAPNPSVIGGQTLHSDCERFVLAYNREACSHHELRHKFEMKGASQLERGQFA